MIKLIFISTWCSLSHCTLFIFKISRNNLLVIVNLLPSINWSRWMDYTSVKKASLLLSIFWQYQVMQLQEMDATTFREFTSHEWHIGVVSKSDSTLHSLMVVACKSYFLSCCSMHQHLLSLKLISRTNAILSQQPAFRICVFNCDVNRVLCLVVCCLEHQVPLFTKMLFTAVANFCPGQKP